MPENLICHACGGAAFDDACDGFFYCLRCGSQIDGVIETGNAAEDFIEGAIYSGRQPYQRRHHPSLASAIKPESLSQYESQRLSEMMYDDAFIVKPEIVDTEPTEPRDFGSTPLSFENRCLEVKTRYIMGIESMVQLQCEALVEKFGASPLICGIAGSIFLRFIAGTRVFDVDWGYKEFHESEIQKPGDSDDFKPRGRHRDEPHNMHGRRAVAIWFQALRKIIPQSHSLVISYLSCHISRSAILPTDILKWSLEGKLPYFSAFLEIEKRIGRPSSACPLSSMLMYRPSQAVPLQKLESTAASFAQSLGLLLPPVNFYSLASRYLKELFLPVEKILPHACRVYEWLLPTDLWLSANELKLPTRVCIMSVLIVSIRILYDINGFGRWESSLSGSSGPLSTFRGKMDNLAEESFGDSSNAQSSEFDAVELLSDLEARYEEIGDKYDFSKDLPSYLQFCKDVVFAGMKPPFEDHFEEKTIEQLWNFHQNEKDIRSSDDLGAICSNGSMMKRPRDDVASPSNKNKRSRREGCFTSLSITNQTSCVENYENDNLDIDESIRRMKSNMEEDLFYYIPPRVKIKRLDYLHYVRKRHEGALTYVAHADYYILLRACARAAQVDIRIMHAGVLCLERRLAWTDKRIHYCLPFNTPIISCEFCSNVDDSIT